MAFNVVEKLLIAELSDALKIYTVRGRLPLEIVKMRPFYFLPETLILIDLEILNLRFFQLNSVLHYSPESFAIVTLMDNKLEVA